MESVGVGYRESYRFKTWKKHARDMYQTLCHMDTTWPSNTAQLLPFMVNQSEFAGEQTVLMGSRTGGREQNFVYFVKLVVPTRSILEPEDAQCELWSEIGGFGRAPNFLQMEVTMRMFHDGDVLRARYMPANPNVVATASSNGDLYIFDRSAVPLSVPPNKVKRPVLPAPVSDDPPAANCTAAQRTEWEKRKQEFENQFKKQAAWDKQRGAGQHKIQIADNPRIALCIDWNTATDGALVAGFANAIHMIQVGDLPKGTKTCEPCWKIESQSPVNEVRFSMFNPSLFAAAHDDATLRLFDSRTGSVVSSAVLPNQTSCVSVDWSTFVESLLAVGSGAGEIRVFDTRRLTSALQAVECHGAESEVTCLAWSPHASNVVATAGEDGLSCVIEILDGRVLFKHAAHTTPITDLCWSWQDCFAGHLLTVDDNAVSFWKSRASFFR